MVTTAKPPKTKIVRLPKTRSKDARVDREKRAIYGVSVMTAGYIPKLDAIADESTLQGVLEDGLTAPNGIKSRLTHPTMSDDGIAKRTAMLHNFSMSADKTQVLADVFFDDTKFARDAADELMTHAEEHPETFGLSGAWDGVSLAPQLDANGEEMVGADGKPLKPIVMMVGLRAVDFVDDPAANPGGLFENPRFLAAHATSFLDETFSDLSPIELRDKLDNFLNAYFEMKGVPPMVEPLVTSTTNSTVPVTLSVPIPATAPVVPAPINQIGLTAADVSAAVAAGVAQAMAAENTRRELHAKHVTICEAFGCPNIIAVGLANQARDEVHLKSLILDWRAKESGPGQLGFVPTDPVGGLSAGSASADKLAGALTTALSMRMLSSSGASVEDIDKYILAAERAPGFQDFRVKRLDDLGRQYLETIGVRNARNLSRDDVAMICLGFGRQVGVQLSGDIGFHTTASFPNIMMDAMKKTLLRSYQEYNSTWRQVFRVGDSTPDFKPINRIRMGESPDMTIWPGQHTQEEVSFTDERESYSVEAYKNRMSFDWKSFVNDDMGALSRIPSLMGVGAARTQDKVFWSTLTTNAGLGPALADNFLWFSAASGSRKQSNVAAVAAAISIASLDIAYAQMALIRGVNTRAGGLSDAILNIMPRWLVVPKKLEVTALQVVKSAYDKAQTNSITFNPFTTLEVVADPRLDTNPTRWYLFADANQWDTAEMTFLSGQETPVMRNWEDPESWARIFTAVQSFAPKPIDWRASFTNAGV